MSLEGYFQTWSTVPETTDGDDHDVSVVEIPEDTSITFDVVVMAKSLSGVHATWRQQATFRRNGSGNAAVVGAVLNIISAQKELGALLWDADIVVADNTLKVRIKGATSVDVGWLLYGTWGLVTITE